MRTFRAFVSALIWSFAGWTTVAAAHPMGNLSVNHYARLEPRREGVAATYVLDLAELPTFELMQTWGVAADTPKAALNAKAGQQAREWIANLNFRAGGRVLTPEIESTDLAIIDGAGNLPVFRITTKLFIAAAGGRLDYEDHNYPTRAGWREIVIRGGAGATIQKSSNRDTDLSQALTAYPQDPTKAPPQDTRAWVEWKTLPVSVSESGRPTPGRPTSGRPMTVTAAPVVETDVRPAEPRTLGTVKRNDAISRILREKNISWPLIATLVGLAFWFGALHALEPGHGKTMVAAYLVGERGTPKHAVFLGGMVTFTHTAGVFLLGVATMFLSRYIMPEKISRVLGIVSGLSIVWIGGVLLWRRWRALGKKRHGHHHDHSHNDHSHHDDGHTHTHDGHTHTHLPQGDISLGSLVALGASGGLVPCPSALILLLSAISIGRPGLGVVLLIVFSLGLATVLMATGLAVLYAKKLLPQRKRADNLVFRYMPVVSAAVILAIGMVMTSVSLGWLPATRLLS